MSLDGFIATKDDSLDFLSAMEEEGQDYGYVAFKSSIDTVIMGRRTYDKVVNMGFPNPHPDKKTYIITRESKPDLENIAFYNQDVVQLIQKLKDENGLNIYCDGGASLAQHLFSNHAIDEIIISVIPILLGDGIRLFDGVLPQKTLTLSSNKAFPKGLVQLHYQIENK